MGGRVKSTIAATLMVLRLATLSGVVSAELKNDFLLYPEGARACLIEAADGSGCSGDTASEMNGCLCRNEGNFVLPSARCIGKDSPDDLEAVYTQLVSNCNDSKTDVTVTKQEFLDAGAEGATATSSVPSNTGTATNTGGSGSPTATNNGDDTASSSLTTAEIAGISVVGAVVLASIAAGIFVFLRRRRARQNTREESHPMLSPGVGSQTPGPGAGPTPSTPYATSPNTISELPTAEMGGATPAGAMVAGQWTKGSMLSPTKDNNSMYSGATPSPNASGVNGSWGSPPPGYSYTAQHDGQVYEMPNTPVPAHDAAAAAAAAAAGIAAPPPAEMDATQTVYHGAGGAPSATGGR